MSMPSPTRFNSVLRRAASLRGRLIPLLALALGSLAMFSCITDKPKDETQLTFAIDTTKFGDFDSLRLDVFAGKDSVHPVETKTVKITKGSDHVTVTFSDAVPADFHVVVTAYDSAGVAYHKDYAYTGGKADKADPVILVSAIQGSDMALEVGHTAKPALTLVPGNAADKRLVLTSEDSATVKVIGDSLKGLRVGRKHVTASTPDGLVKLTFSVNVTSVKVADLKIDDLFLKVGDSVTPSVTVLPSDASDKGYSLKLIDSNGVLSVSGKSVKALKNGSARVLASSADLGDTTSFLVTVRIPVTDFSARDLNGRVGDKLLPDLTWTPDSSTDHAVTLKPRDSLVVEAKGDTLIAKAQGTDSVEVTSHDGGFTRVFKVTIGARVIHPDSLQAKGKRILVGDTVPPTLDWSPDSATDQQYSLRSFDTATVAIVGKRLAGKQLGAAQIEVTSEDGGLKDTFVVNVEPPAFQSDILPITSLKCAPCHIPGTTFNWQDSSALVQKGVSAIDRLTRPDGSTGKMPQAGATGGAITARELTILLDWLGHNVVPLKSYAVKDTSVSLGDTVTPGFTFDPDNATDKIVKLTAVDTAIASVIGATKLVARSLGQTTVIAESDETGTKVNFKVTVKAPDFQRNVLPITSFKCAPCHSPGTTFNWTDSVELLKDGAEAIDRLKRAPGTVGRMPLMPGAPNGDITASQLAVLLGWLQSKVVPVTGMTAPDDTLKQGQQRAPGIVWTPANATGRLYTLLITDTNIVGLRGSEYVGKTLGTTTVQIRAHDGGFSKTINVQVVPMPLDSIVVQDTAGRVGDTIVPKIIFFPPTATNKSYAFTEEGHSGAVLIKGDTLIATAEGNALMVAIPGDGGTLKSRGFRFKVAPIPPASISARDTNGVIDQLVLPKVTVLPVNATNRDFDLTVDPADTAVATIVASTQIKGKKVGSAKIHVRADGDSTIKTSLTFTVGPVKLVSIVMTDAKLPIGTTFNARSFINWNPTNATDQRFKLSNVDTAKFTLVGDTAIIPKHRPGGNITVTALDSNRTALWAVMALRSPYQGTVAGIFGTKCIACHFSGGGLPNWQDSATVVSEAFVPTNPTKIMDRIQRDSTLSGTMPPLGSPRLTPQEVTTLVQWLSQ